MTSKKLKVSKNVLKLYTDFCTVTSYRTKGRISTDVSFEELV